MMIIRRISFAFMFASFIALVACGENGSATPTSGLVVSNAIPASANGTFALSAVTTNTVAGITQVKIADPTNAGRSLQIFYNAASTLTSVIYTSPESALSLMTCVVGSASSPCPAATIFFDLLGKKITFSNATFTQVTISVGTLNGTVSW
jgi:hypothetical protein